jgi:EAL domain-containing protein (putative c-di-GMP-specific phosphodiesterase class I)
MSLLDTVGRLRDTRALLEHLIENPEKLGPDWQPVRVLSDDTVVGYKATGAAHGTEMADTLALLTEAQGLGLVERLDYAFRAHAFTVALTRGLAAQVWITPEPETYGTVCPPRLIGAIGRGKRELKVVAEVPEDSFERTDTEAAVAEFRSWGWQIAVRDVADVAGAIERVERMRPDVVMVDLSRPGRAPGATAPAVRRLLELASSCGATVLALGVDSPARRTDAVNLGATLGRGILLGSPAPLP